MDLVKGNLHLRVETEADHYAVENVTREAHWVNSWTTDPEITDVTLLVDKLRKCAAYLPSLHYVAEIDGEIVGHIIYSKTKIVDETGNEHETLTFGPLSVLPKYQGQGIGKALLNFTFDAAKMMGYRAIIIFGHPDYYPRVGFRRCAEFGITTGDGNNFDPFMVLPLYEGALDGISGRYFYDPVYDNLPQEEVLEFEKKFPPKEMHTAVPLSVLLDKLNPEEQRALNPAENHSLAVMQTKSVDFLLAQEGVTQGTIEVIRAVMKENGYAWGTHGENKV